MERQETYTETRMAEEAVNVLPEVDYETLFAENHNAQMRDYMEVSMQYWKEALRAYQEMLKEDDSSSII